jgi:hypothetical protein
MTENEELVEEKKSNIIVRCGVECEKCADKM